jgi:hypothetical protein
MLDAAARMLLDLMDKAVQEGRPKPNTLPYMVAGTIHVLRDLAMAWLRSSRLSRPIRNQWKILQSRLTRECPLLARNGPSASV